MIKKEDLSKLMTEIGVDNKVFCDENETKQFNDFIKNNMQLPTGVYVAEALNGTRCFYRIERSGLSEEEQKQYLFLKLMSDVQSMKNCMIFFTVITIISLIATLFVSCSVIG